MKLSIVTINYNNAEGLRMTMESVLKQTYRDIEYIVVDGASTDGSMDVIREMSAALNDEMSQSNDGMSRADALNEPLTLNDEKMSLICSSEPDNGIYNAMNKGIKRASGEYIQILNSGDILASPDVTQRMMDALRLKIEDCRLKNEDGVGILYGNMIKKDYGTGKIIGKSGEVEYSLRQYYSATLNHDCCYIRRDLFDMFGLYDENLNIVSDWKWFLQAIGLGKVKPVYVNIDVTIFDASGISETNLELRKQERRLVLEELMPPAVLEDYDKHAFETYQMDRLRKHHLYGLVYFMERVLFKLEKWSMLK